jgi:hypothetical protein
MDTTTCFIYAANTHNTTTTETHTSQVATNGGITPKASSESEESNQNDDNDDRLSWHEVRGRGKKRRRPETTKAPTVKKNELQETSNNPTHVTATNSSEALRHAENEGNTRHERTDPAPPSVFVSRTTSMQRLTATVEQVDNRLNYTLKITDTNTTEILTAKLDCHKIILDTLKEKKVEFHTYQPRQQRAYRVVIRNLHHSVQQQLVREEIERKGHKIGNLWNIRHRVTVKPLPLFLDIELADKNN